MFRRASLLVFALPVVLTVGIACGDPRNEDDEDSTSTATEAPAETETAEVAETETAEATETEAPEEPEEPSGPTTLELTADNIAFSTDRLEAPPGEITVHFTNQEALPHNFSLYEDEGFSEDIVIGEILASAGDSEEIDAGELEAGTYYFRCDVHPVDMVGELIVG